MDEVEPTNLNFILSGDAIVYSSYAAEGIQMRLNMGQIFGESHLTRAASFNYLGDIRSGLRPVHLLAFSYSDLDRIVSFPEKAKLE